MALLATGLVVACGDDEGGDDPAGGGSSGSGSGGTSPGGGGEGGAGEPVTCTDPTPPSGETLAIEGNYTDDFEGEHAITSETWTSYGYVYNISQFDNDEMFVIALGDQDSGGLAACVWNRFDWTEVDGDLYYCNTVFDAATEQEALDAEPADPSDPENGGCGEGSFPWTLLTPQ